MSRPLKNGAAIYDKDAHMRIFNQLVFTLAVMIASPILAHEGHADAPGSVVPPHGGKIQATSELYLEFVKSGDVVKIFPMSHDLKPVPTSEITLSIQLELPRQKVKQPVSPETQSDSWSAKIDAKGAHRFTLIVASKRKNKSETVKFTAEN